MEYKSSPDRLSKNPSVGSNGKKIVKEKRDKVEELLKDGQSAGEVSKATGVNKHAVLAIRDDLQDKGGFELGSWKKNTANLLSQIVTKGSNRLMTEIDNIPAGQLPLAIAIMTDKIMSLQDAPAVVVEHRLKVSHNDINAMIRGEIIDVTPKLEDKDKA